MDEKTALEELQFIRKVIDEGKKSVVYNGKDYIFWGLIVIVGMMATFIFHHDSCVFQLLLDLGCFNSYWLDLFSL